MPNKYLIYKATSPSNKYYIGITSDFIKRKRDHKRHSLNSSGNKYYNKPFYRAIRKYGWNNIQWEILYYSNCLSDLKNKEKYFIKLYDSLNSGYNCTKGGDGVFGYKFTKEQRKIISQKTKKAMEDPEIRKKCAKGNKGKPAYNRKKVIDDFGNIYNSITEVANKFNVSVSAISLCLSKKTKLHNKHNFYYYEVQNAK